MSVILNIFLGFVLNFCLFLTIPINSHEEKREKVIISSSEAKTLEDYAKAFLTATPLGYSLLGEKPAAFHNYQFPEDNHGDDWLSSYLWSGNEVLKRIYHLNPEADFYLLINELCGEIIVINKLKFLQVVNDNLSLFRYVLGPTLTAQSLLESIIQHKNLYAPINNDEVLIGILLGFGTESSILYRRYLQIKENPLSTPSWGFTDLQTEQDFVLNQMNEDIHPFLINHAPILNFCSIGSEKSLLVEKYLHTQLQIREALLHENLFQKLWSKIQPNVELFIHNKPFRLEKISFGTAQKEQYADAKKQAELEADKFLKHLATEKDIIEIEPGAVYLKLLAQGSGEPISNYPLLRCSVPDAKGYPIQEECVQQIDLNRAIKGLQNGLRHRKVGDHGILYIHPSWTDDDYWSLPYHLITFHFEILLNKNSSFF